MITINQGLEFIQNEDNIHIVFYDSLTVNFSFEYFEQLNADAELTSFDFTGYAVRAYFKQSVTSSDVLIKLGNASDSVFTNQDATITGNISTNDSGLVSILINKTNAQLLSTIVDQGVFDIVAESDTRRFIVVQGTFEIKGVVSNGV